MCHHVPSCEKPSECAVDYAGIMMSNVYFGHGSATFGGGAIEFIGGKSLAPLTNITIFNSSCGSFGGALVVIAGTKLN